MRAVAAEAWSGLLLFFLGFILWHAGPARAVAAAGDSPNLIENSSFEAGIDYRFAAGRWYLQGLPAVSLDAETGVHGAYSARLPVSRTALTRKPAMHEGATLRAAVPVMVQAGAEYSFSVYLRSDAARNGRLTITRNSPSGHREPAVASRDIVIGRQWKRAGLTFKASSSEEIYWEIHVSSSEAGSVWVDALQLERGGYGDYQPKSEIEAGLTSSRLGRIFTPPENVEIILRAFNHGATGVSNKNFSLRVLDFTGVSVHSQNIGLTLPPRGGAEQGLALPIKRHGAYRAILTDALSGEPHGELSFSVLPPARTVAMNDSAFGAYLTIASEPLDIAHRLGFRWIGSLTSNGRMASWISVEPQPGQFLWYDDEIADARQRGFGFMFDLGPCSMPAWAGRLEPEQRLRRWTEYVGAMARHYRGLVQYWTISDEADHKKGCWSGAAEYARWHKMGSDAIKAADEQAGVVMNSSPTFGDQAMHVLASGGVDVLSGNYYHTPSVIREIRDVARRHGVRQVWAPGIGEWTPSFYPRLAGSPRDRPAHENDWPEVLERQARNVVQTIAYGARRLFHYTASYVGNTDNYSIFDIDSGLKPTGTQFGALIWLLDGFQDAAEITTGGNEKPLWAYRVNRRDGKVIYPLWGMPSMRQEVLLPGHDAGQNAVLYDHFANEIALTRDSRGTSFVMGRQPVFLQLPERFAPQADKALRSATVRLLALPQAGAREISGKFAKLADLNDGADRPRPNVSLWYDSGRHGWVELFRHRSSHFPASYSVDDAGITVEWNFIRRPEAFHIGIGQFPPDLVRGARLVAHESREGRKKWYESDDACEGKPRASATRAGWIRDVDMRQPHGLAFLLRSGLVVVVETEITAGADILPETSLQPGAWSVVRQGGACFLHAYYPAGQGGNVRVRSRIRVVEPGMPRAYGRRAMTAKSHPGRETR